MVKKSTKGSKVVLKDIKKETEQKKKLEKTSKAKDVLNGMLSSIEVAEPIIYEGLSVFPIYDVAEAVKQKVKDQKLVVMQEAIEKKILEIEDTGTIGELNFHNKSEDIHILLIEGEIVKGGKQDRMINVTFILRPNTKKLVPTSCIEQGRWTNGLGKFEKSAGYVDFDTHAVLSNSVSMSNLNRPGCYCSDQSGVWGSIGNNLRAMSVQSNSSNYTKIYEVKEEEINEILLKIKNKLVDDKSMIGLFCCLNGDKIFAEIFTDSQFFEIQRDKLLRSSIVELLKAKDETSKEISLEKIIKILNSIKDISINTYKTPDEGQSIRFEMKPGIVGTALLCNNEIIHLSLIGSLIKEIKQNQTDFGGPGSINVRGGGDNLGFYSDGSSAKISGDDQNSSIYNDNTTIDDDPETDGN